MTATAAAPKRHGDQGRQEPGSETDPERTQRLADHGDFTQPIRDSVATIVLVKEPGGNDFDIGRAAQNMMLAAKAIGVASCPITLHRERAAAAFLGIPEGASARYAVALGYPVDGAQPRRFGGRKPAADVVTLERCGGADVTPPQVAWVAPADGAQVSGTVQVSVVHLGNQQQEDASLLRLYSVQATPTTGTAASRPG